MQTFTVLKNKNHAFTVLFDSTKLKVHDFAIADFDGNGFNDIAISGRNNMNQVILTVLEFRNGFDTLRTLRLPLAVDGTLETGDLNHDGFNDLLVSGYNNSGIMTTQSFINQVTSFTPGRSFTGLKNAILKIADFDSDGKADISFLGQNNLDQPLNWIYTFTGDSISLPTAHVIDQIAGDFDRDGDLDLLQVTDTLGLVISENKALAINSGPSNPTNPIAVRVFNRLFMYWEKPADDHTPTHSITYDLFLSSGPQIVLSGEFDRSMLHRLTVTPGNQGTNNYALLDVPAGNYSFQIQSIDNAFHTATHFGTCQGISQTCLSVRSESITSCDHKPVLLVASSPSAMWFSLSRGFLGRSDTLKIDPTDPDSVFSFVPQLTFSCPNIKLYTIQALSDTLFFQANHALCEKDTLQLKVGNEWQNIVWRDSTQNQLATGNLFSYQPTHSDVITATGNNRRGCFIKQQDTVTISKPDLVLNGDDFQILKGQSVSLHASGGTTYEWIPPTGLDRNDIPDPVASPDHTTRYSITIRDSIGCTASGSVLVEVADAAFIANLFTPNGDGKNDALRIFGLYVPQNFHFWIYNREGNVVFETQDYHLAMAQGWNGNVNGNQQSTGLYFWKLEGTDSSGQPLKLNGKRTGSALLVR